MQSPDTNENEAMRLSIVNFLVREMKIPEEVVNGFKFTRIFPPASQPTSWNRLYVEFQSQMNVDLINQFLPNLQQGKSVSLYIPRSLFSRFNAVQEIAYKYRQGEIKHKTRIKYGISDFVLSVEPKQGASPWTFIHLDLPSLQLMPDVASTHSSPPGARPRLSSKRQLSPNSTDELTERVNRPKLNVIPDPPSYELQSQQTSHLLVDQESDRSTSVLPPTSSGVCLPAINSLN